MHEDNVQGIGGKMKKISFALAFSATLAAFSTVFAGIALVTPVSLAEPIKMLFFGVSIVGIASFAKNAKR